VNFFELLFPDFSLIALGLIICRTTALDRSVWDKVEQLVYWVLFPAMLFYSVVKSPLDIKAASSLVAAALGLALTGIAASYALVHLPGLKNRFDVRQHAASAQVGFRFNSFIVLAIAERLGGAQCALYVAVIVGCCVPVFNIAAVYPMAKNSERGLFGELLRNPLIWATASGLLFNLLGFQLPQWIVPTLSRLGAASIALGLMAACAAMAFDRVLQAKTLGVSLLFIRHLMSPLVAWGLSRAFKLDPVQTLALLAFAGTPTASSCHVLANRMGFDGGFVAGLVTLSTLLAVFSLPFALSFS
jgi:malonate transporter and related proteins